LNEVTNITWNSCT